MRESIVGTTWSRDWLRPTKHDRVNDLISCLELVPRQDHSHSGGRSLSYCGTWIPRDFFAKLC